MNPISIWFFLICLWVLCHFWLLPLSKDRWKAADLSGKLARAGSLVVLEKVRDLAAIGAIVLGAVVFLVWICELLAISSLVGPQAAIQATAAIYEVVKTAGEQYGSALGTVTLLAAAIALYLAAKHARQRISSAWIAKAQEIHEKLHQDPLALDAARADESLRPATDLLDKLIARVVAHNGGGEGAVLSAPELEQTHEQVSQVLSALAIDMARNELKFDEAVVTPTSDETSKPRTRWERLLRVVASDRFCKDLGFVKKPLSYVTTGLLVVSLLGWTAEPLANGFQLAVNNLRVNVFDQEAQRNLDSALSKARNLQPDPQEIPPEIVPGVESTARLIARAAISDMARSGLLDRLAQARRAPISEAEFVRAAINDHHIVTSTASNNAEKVRHEVADAVAHHSDATAALGRAEEQLGREIQPHVERMQRENPRSFAHWANRL